MRLLTHNFLVSTIEGVTNNYPLKIEVKKAIVIEDDFEPDYLKRLFYKINWKALVYASKVLGYTKLPEEFPDASVLDSEEFLKKFHHALLERHLEEGALVCPETGRRFPVKNGLPNMSRSYDEILVSGDKSNSSKKKKQARKKRRNQRNKQKQILPNDDESIPSPKKEPGDWVGKEINWYGSYKPKITVIRMSSYSSSDDDDF